MNIHYYTDYNENGTPDYKYIDVDISENATLREVFLKIHEIENIPLFTEIVWNGNTEKIARSYYISDGFDSGSCTGLKDEELEKKISEFPKNGPNGELSLYLDNSTGGLIN